MSGGYPAWDGPEVVALWLLERERDEFDDSAEVPGPQAWLRRLLQHCVRARRAEALALLDQHPSLLNLRWAGAAFDFQHNGGVALHPSSTVLITASQGEDLALVRELLERGADLHARDGYNWTALHSAAFLATSPEVCELLLSRGIELMAKNTPL